MAGHTANSSKEKSAGCKVGSSSEGIKVHKALLSLSFVNDDDDAYLKIR